MQRKKVIIHFTDDIKNSSVDSYNSDEEQIKAKYQVMFFEGEVLKMLFFERESNFKNVSSLRKKI